MVVSVKVRQTKNWSFMMLVYGAHSHSESLLVVLFLCREKEGEERRPELGPGSLLAQLRGRIPHFGLSVRDRGAAPARHLFRLVVGVH